MYFCRNINSLTRMKIAILGTRGIPNYHGGFEQFAEFFSEYLANKDIDVSVYCSSTHLYKEKTYRNIKLIHCYDPEYKIGTAGQFIYDLNCILDSRKRDFDVILQLGYTSNSIWYFLLPKKSVIITNMDGLEWKRSKYSAIVQKFLKFAEKLAVKHSDYLISDSVGIKQFLEKKYDKSSKFIAYGATVFDAPDSSVLKKYSLTPYSYDLLIARIEPENNIETIIKGYLKKQTGRKLLIIGNQKATKFGKYLYNSYSSYDSIEFIGSLYDMNVLNNLRYYSNLYFHGHSVGGTNPSLLEAMASDCFIIAHNNVFNRSILEDDACYFEDENQIADLLDINKQDVEIQSKLAKNKNKITGKYSWNNINASYLDYIIKCFEEQKLSKKQMKTNL